MSAKVETLEKSMVKLTIEVDADKFEEGIKHAYNKNRGKIAIPGFRKGKAPRKIIEKTYGAGIFYEDAANYLIPDAYDKAVEELDLEVVSRPTIDVEQLESGKSFIFTAEVAVKPEIELGQYKGLEVSKQVIEVEDSEIQAEIDKVREQNARIIDITDRPVQGADQVAIDFEGFVDGEAFEGGKGENFELTIGSGTFIDTFEEQLIGTEIGEEKEVNVTFPEEYHQESLQGKPATFKVSVKGIKEKELPELNDELAKDVSEFETLDEYKNDIKATIKERKENDGKRQKQEEVIKKAIENSTVELPDPMIDLEAENMSYDFSQRLQYQGLSIEQYFSVTGQNMASLKETMKKQAEEKIKGSLLFEAVAKAENLEVSEEEYLEELTKMAEMYNMEIDKLKENVKEEEKQSIMQDLLNQKAIELIANEAVEVE
jgi:trigger factor